MWFGDRNFKRAGLYSAAQDCEIPMSGVFISIAGYLRSHSDPGVRSAVVLQPESSSYPGDSVHHFNTWVERTQMHPVCGNDTNRAVNPTHFTEIAAVAYRCNVI